MAQNCTFVSGKVEILDEIASIKEEITILERQDVKLFVVISHVGYNKDKEIAAKVNQVDLIVGGHTNTFLYNGKPCTCLAHEMFRTMSYLMIFLWISKC